MTKLPTGFPASRAQAEFESRLNNLRQLTDRLRQEAVSERKQDVAQDLRGAISEVLSIEKRINETKEYRDNISLASTRAELTQNTLSTLNKAAMDVAQEGSIAEQSGMNMGLEAASAAAKAALSAVTGALNITVGDRSLFAGDAGFGSAIADKETILQELGLLVSATVTPEDTIQAMNSAFSDSAGVFATKLYKGGAGNAPPIEIGPNERISYQVRADDKAIKNVIQGISSAAIALDKSISLSNEQRNSLFQHSLDILRNATPQITEIASSIGAVEARLANISANLTAEETDLSLLFNQLSGANGLEATTQLISTENEIERLFFISSKISNLSLVKYLR